MAHKQKHILYFFPQKTQERRNAAVENDPTALSHISGIGGHEHSDRFHNQHFKLTEGCH